MKYVYIVGVLCVNFLPSLLTRVQISLLVSLYGSVLIQYSAVHSTDQKSMFPCNTSPSRYSGIFLRAYKSSDAMAKRQFLVLDPCKCAAYPTSLYLYILYFRFHFNMCESV